jgi:hypothetical protein
MLAQWAKKGESKKYSKRAFKHYPNVASVFFDAG